MTFISGPPWLDCFEEFLDFSKEIWKSREFGIIAPIIGLLLIVFGIVQWTSLVSQSMRAFGAIDTLAISLFVGGILVLLLGSFSLASSQAVSNTTTTIQISIEDRLRQLDDLRSKNLISDIEYEERRKNIIAAAWIAEPDAAHQRLSARVVEKRGHNFTGSVTNAASAASAPSPRTVLLPPAGFREPWVSLALDQKEKPTMEYYLYLNDEQKGPYTLSQIQSMWRSGNITGNTLYWQDGFSEWIPLSTILHIIEPPPIAPAPSIPRAAVKQPITNTPSDSLGIVIMLLPIASAALMWFWISGMNLLQNPSSTLNGIAIVTILATAALIAVEASQLGIGQPIHGKRTTGPVGWFICTLLIWIIAYPSYLFYRSKFGVKNYVVGGIASALIFLFVAGGMSYAIEQQKAEVRHNFDEANQKLQELQNQLKNFSTQ